MAGTRKHLVAFREANGNLSQEDAGKLVGITQAHWSRLENGKAYADPKLAQKIAGVTGAPMASLLNLGDNETSSNAAD